MRIIGKDVDATREATIVASGTLPNGKPVVVNADGTVSVVGESSITEAVGTAVTYDTGAAGENEVVYDSNAQKIVVTYRDTADLNRGHAVVGTVNASNNSISFGTPVQFTTTNLEWSDATYDPVNNKVVIAYADSQGSRYGYAIVGDVSGTSISFGSQTVFNSYEVQHVAIGYAGDGKVVIAYEDWGNSNYGMAIVGTISGTSISFGTEVVYESARSQWPSIVYDASAQKTVIGFSTYANSEHGYAKVGTVSGTSISFGSKTIFQSSVIQDLESAYDSSAQKVVFVYRDAGNSFYGTAVVGTVSGTSISFGSSTVFNAANTNKPSVAFDANVGKICIAYRDNGNSSYGTVRSGTVSGTSITFDSEFVINAANSNQWGAGYDASAKKVVFAFYDASSTDGEAVVYQPSGSVTNLTAENYIGISDGDIDTITQSESVGTPTVFESGELGSNSVAYDSANNKIVITYRDTGNNGYGTAVVGTVSGTSITFGTPVVFYSASINNLSSVFDSSNGKIVTTYRNASLYPSSRVGTVSGTSISYGSEVVITASNNAAISSVYDSTNNKVVVTYAGAGGGIASTVVGTVSGTSISYGSATTTEAAYNSSMGFDTTNGKVILFLYTTSQAGNARVGTVSGNSITFGSAATVPSTVQYLAGVVHDSSANKMVIGYTKASGPATAIVGTVSGTSISFGSETEVQTSGTSVLSMGFDSLVNKVVYTYRYGPSPYNGRLRVGTVSGTSITFASEVTFESGTTSNLAIGYDSTEGTSVISYRDEGNSNFGTAVGFQAAGSYDIRGETPNGGGVKVLTQGSVSDLQSGLTSGKSYYVQANGTLSTTAGNPSVFAGTAVSATKLIVKG